ncbi:ThuA domain-containing protein [Novosphingobium sp. FSY-8]|uniref:ThuA domain-containing protein n=1 Tax=Novosphingobium ovatum TaxID=1908523 RepID=A0ABW9XI67_9SPHN|nr:ThuA domain-containing protein [Novosphingobium ovatum]NBC38087.1 ThuA domain-containing protein [Novosphingobium ovatum]
MPIIKHRAPLQALVAVRGHPFDRTAFDAMFQAMDGIAATMVDQPAAALLMNPDAMADFDVLVLYDMPGLDFEAPEGAPHYREPSEALKAGFRGLLEAGKGVVALHHALAGWPTWGDYHDWLGGQFLYRPGTVRGEPRLDSGYRHEVTHTVTPLPHPVTEGVEPFTLTDELYLAQVFAEDVTPLLVSDAAFTRDHFWSAHLAVQGQMFCHDGWEHPAGSSLVGWTRQALNSRLVYLQPGDGPSAYEHPAYRRLVENAIRWVAAD